MTLSVVTFLHPGFPVPLAIAKKDFDAVIRKSLDPEERARRFAVWKASLRIAAQPKPSRWDGAAALVDAGYPCTGVSAGWCATCGDCICDREEGPFDDPKCPLHAPDSPHAEGKVE